MHTCKHTYACKHISNTSFALAYLHIYLHWCTSQKESATVFNLSRIPGEVKMWADTSACNTSSCLDLINWLAKRRQKVAAFRQMSKYSTFPFQDCHSETGFRIGMGRNFVCLWRRHNCNWSLPFCAEILIYEINYFVSNNSDLHAIISTLLIIIN